MPFDLDGPEAELTFDSLHRATAAVQDAGINRLWRKQFAQVGLFLNKIVEDPETLLQPIWLDQARAISQVGSNGADLIAAYALRELQLERALP